MSQNLLVVQGEYQVSDQADAVISTLLGSCIATCLFDLRVGVGGFNHFLLAGDNGRGGGGEIENLKYGVHAMELLINSLLRLSARKENLQAKLFGGARMSENFSDIGTENAVLRYNFSMPSRSLASANPSAETWRAGCGSFRRPAGFN